MKYVGNVLRTPGSAYLLVFSMVGRLPVAMAALAIIRLVREQGGSYGLASVLTATYVIAGTIGQPALGKLVDRVGQARVLLTSAVVVTAAFLGLQQTAVTLPAAGLACTVVAGLATPPLESCLRSLWPRIVRPGDELRAAFSLDAAGQEVLFVVGPLVTVFGIAVFGESGNIALMATLGLLGTVAFAMHRVARAVRPAPTTQHREDGGQGPLRCPGFVWVLLLQFGIGFPVGGLTITVSSFGEHLGSESFAGWALAANAIGGLTGAMLIARYGLPKSPAELLRVLGIMFSLAYLPMAAAILPSGWWLVTAYLAGLLLPVTLTQVFSLTEQMIPVSRLTEANAWVVSAINLGIAAGTMLGGFLAERLAGAPAIAVIVAVCSTTALLTALVCGPRRLGAPPRVTTF